MNLVTNAIKYTPEGIVSVKTSPKEQSSEAITISISVSDTGIGIPQHEMHKLFAPFASYLLKCFMESLLLHHS